MPLARLRNPAGGDPVGGAAIGPASAAGLPLEDATLISPLLDLSTPPAGSTVQHPPAAVAAAGGAAVDIDDLVERAWRALMARLATEQERRGFTRWA